MAAWLNDPGERAHRFHDFDRDRYYVRYPLRRLQQSFARDFSVFSCSGSASWFSPLFPPPRPKSPQHLLLRSRNFRQRIRQLFDESDELSLGGVVHPSSNRLGHVFQMAVSHVLSEGSERLRQAL
jgi:hypothetical protein